MSFPPEEVRRIAHLAKIGMTQNEIMDNSRHFTHILSFLDQLASYDTSNVAPMVHPHTMTQPLRADEATHSHCRDELQSVAPAVTDGLYLVPQVIE